MQARLPALRADSHLADEHGWSVRRFHSFLILLGRRFAAPRKNQSPLCRGSHCLYACGFRIYFTPLPGFFSPFPHGTGSLSVDHEYLALEDGPPIFRQDYTCPALLVAHSDPPSSFRVRGFHPVSLHFPVHSAKKMVYMCRLFPFRSPLLGESRLISFPPAT